MSKQTKRIERRTADELKATKRRSINKERLSNAGVIGIHVLLGNPVTIKTSLKASNHTYSRLLVHHTTIKGKSLEEYLNESYQIPSEYFDKNKEAIIYNSISSSFEGKLESIPVKKKEATKSVKSTIFQSIQPFTPEGFKSFCSKMIMWLESVSFDEQKHKKQLIEINPCDQRIVDMLHEVMKEEDSLCPNGEMIIQNLFGDKILSPQTQTNQYSSMMMNDENLQINENQNQSTIVMKDEINFWQTQLFFEHKLYQQLEALENIMKEHSEYLDQMSVLNIPGLSKNNGVAHIAQCFKMISNEFEAIRYQVSNLCNNSLTIQQQLVKSVDELNDENIIKKQLAFANPLHLNLVIQAFWQMFSACDLQLASNKEFQRVITSAQQQKLESDLLIYSPNKDNYYINRNLIRILNEEKKGTDELPFQIENVFLYLYNSCCEKENILGDVDEQSHKYAEEVLWRYDKIEIEGLPYQIVSESLKLFLKQLPIKIMNETATTFILSHSATIKQHNDYGPLSNIMKKMLNMCTQESLGLLKGLLQICSKIESLSDLNKMNSGLLATHLTDCLFSLRMKNSDEINTLIKVTEYFIRYFKHLFPEYTNDITLMRSKLKEIRMENTMDDIIKNIQKEVEKGGMEEEQLPSIVRSEQSQQSNGKLFEGLEHFVKKKK